MDPHLEAPWVFPDFHAGLIFKIGEHLVVQVRPRYSVRKERRVYLEKTDPSALIVGDVVVARERRGSRAVRDRGSLATLEPAQVVVAMPVEARESYLEIRDPRSGRVVTLIEVVSPANKRSGSDGQREYLDKRQEVLASQTHLVELDLLRGGSRPRDPVPVPSCHYYVLVSRAGKRPRAEAYCWDVRAPMPVIPVPLGEGDPDVGLDLQAVFDATYQAADYSYTVRYGGACEPPLSRTDAAWARKRVAAWRTGSK